jgi:hypothetical protein
MMNKIKGLLSSIRFWVYTLGATAGFLAEVSANGFNLEKLFLFIAGWLGVVGVTGGLDKWFEKKQQ